MDEAMNIPIFRAKDIDTSRYFEGLLTKDDFGNYAIQIEVDDEFECDYALYLIDPSTLAIHSPDMLASDSDRLLPNGEKDLRIFASLSEDGKGGDIIRYEDEYDTRDMIVKYRNFMIDLFPVSIIKDSYHFKGATLHNDLKIIGIEE